MSKPAEPDLSPIADVLDKLADADRERVVQYITRLFGCTIELLEKLEDAQETNQYLAMRADLYEAAVPLAHAGGKTEGYEAAYVATMRSQIETLVPALREFLKGFTPLYERGKKNAENVSNGGAARSALYEPLKEPCVREFNELSEERPDLSRKRCAELIAERHNVSYKTVLNWQKETLGE